jgi:uncharacterized protein YfaS (alpha-2-macroglobulin family)
VTNQIDLERFEESYNKSVSTVIPRTEPRLDAFITTDKPVYKPGDTMYVEVYIFDALDKVPYTEQGRDVIVSFRHEAFKYFYYFYSTMLILDPNDQQVFSTSSSTVNSTTSFTWQIPESAVGGEYKIVIQGSYMADSIRKVRVRQYERELLVAQAELSAESYKPGDNVTGVLRVKTPEGTSFQSLPTYSHVVNFG